MGITKISIRKFVKEDDGSISVLVIGLFLLLLTISLILTDISSIYLAKRSLSLATEAAVQRAMKNLDEASYYSGEYNFNQLLVNSFGEAENDPGIPINCGAGLQDVQEVLRSWQQRGTASIRENVANLRLKNYECDGFQIYIETSATAQIPVLIPFIDLSEVEISSFAGAVGERAATNNYYGFDIG
jgi:Flp pilus assembly protein TadG